MRLSQLVGRFIDNKGQAVKSTSSLEHWGDRTLQGAPEPCVFLGQTGSFAESRFLHLALRSSRSADRVQPGCTAGCHRHSKLTARYPKGPEIALDSRGAPRDPGNDHFLRLTTGRRQMLVATALVRP